MILVAVIDNKVVIKTFITKESFNRIKDFLQFLYSECEVIKADHLTGYPEIGYKFVNNKFVKNEA